MLNSYLFDPDSGFLQVAGWPFSISGDYATGLVRSAVSGIRRAKTTRATNAAARGKKSSSVFEMIADHAGSQPAQRGANSLDRGDGALGQIVSSGTAYDVRNHQQGEGAEYPGAHAVECLNADEAESVVGEGVEHRTDGQYGEPFQEQRLASPGVGSPSDQQGNRQ